MPHINDLPATVLRLILYQAAATPAPTLSLWKAKLPLLAVCRSWAKLAIGAVFYHVYVEFTVMSASKFNAILIWSSNAELFISRRCVLMARGLTLEWLGHVTLDYLHYIALEILKLDRVDWQHINSLTFPKVDTIFDHSVKPFSLYKLVVTDIAHTVQYFAQSLRNIVELNLYYKMQGAFGDSLYVNLVACYGHQLQVLRVQGPIPLPVSCIPRNIKVLELLLDSSATHVLPSICGETLRVLKLYDVPRNFAWHHFRYNISVGPIVFPLLTILHLDFVNMGKLFTEGEIRYKVNSGAYNCDRLRFPALRELAIENCTPDCDLLYADIPFPELKKVHLLGSITSIRHCSRLKLSWVRDLTIIIFPSDLGDTADMYSVTNHFFSDICIGRMAAICIIGDWYILDPELMRWFNLTILIVRKVDYSTACKVIGRLPNLTEFRTTPLEFSDMATDSFSAESSLFISADPMLAWGTKLARLTIRNFGKDDSLAACVSAIQALVLHASALKKLFVPQSTIHLVARLSDIYQGRYPHLASIQLLN
ncbi:hypothetical protein GGH94_000062 [Coemansia aciculifera]|uniref:F-box domain-containing protein n=1 Tax=Coemansia aciculifera TaxID=417176 RepID=A0A9W8M9G2_9FUNG|nr:hypothetical protein GGH94_000062 [Coemansia aciculifera]KAJ2877304.1 hypothetical protein GGH93_000045 [Coemansia aciculifera]